MGQRVFKKVIHNLSTERRVSSSVTIPNKTVLPIQCICLRISICVLLFTNGLSQKSFIVPPTIVRQIKLTIIAIKNIPILVAATTPIFFCTLKFFKYFCLFSMGQRVFKKVIHNLSTELSTVKKSYPQTVDNFRSSYQQFL